MINQKGKKSGNAGWYTPGIYPAKNNDSVKGVVGEKNAKDYPVNSYGSLLILPAAQSFLL